MQTTPLPTWLLTIDSDVDGETGEPLMTLAFYSDDGNDTLLKTVGPLRLAPDTPYDAQLEMVRDECQKFRDEQIPRDAMPKRIVQRIGFAVVMQIEM